MLMCICCQAATVGKSRSWNELSLVCSASQATKSMLLDPHQEEHHARRFGHGALQHAICARDSIACPMAKADRQGMSAC